TRPAVLALREERLEKPASDLGGDVRVAVTNGQRDLGSMAQFLLAGDEPESPLAIHGLNGIADEVGEHSDHAGSMNLDFDRMAEAILELQVEFGVRPTSIPDRRFEKGIQTLEVPLLVVSGPVFEDVTNQRIDAV